MAAFATYSVDPNINVSIRGVSMPLTGCPAGNVDNAIRSLAAEGKELSALVAAINVSDKMDKDGGVFTGNITRQTAGGYLYHASSTQTGGAVHFLSTGTPLPSSPAEGTVVGYY